jgi:hypothetical protein
LNHTLRKTNTTYFRKTFRNLLDQDVSERVGCLPIKPRRLMGKGLKNKPGSENRGEKNASPPG